MNYGKKFWSEDYQIKISKYLSMKLGYTKAYLIGLLEMVEKISVDEDGWIDLTVKDLGRVSGMLRKKQEKEFQEMVEMDLISSSTIDGRRNFKLNKDLINKYKEQ